MECLGMMQEGEWSGLFSCNEEADFMAHLLNPNPNHQQQLDSNSCSYEFITKDEFGSCWSDDAGFNLPSLTHRELNVDTTSFLIDQSLNDVDVGEHNLQPKFADDNNRCFDNPKKRSRSQLDVQKNKGEKNPRKNASKNNSEEVESLSRQTSSCCSDQDESHNGSVSPTASPNGKTRASRGSATDPQSLYARKRRERINERLRTLQNLVPNGTKVDLSTMLEEAVQYVKFLQLQIKILSSDDLWMYAPIAYNGMNLGLHDHNIIINTPNSS